MLKVKVEGSTKEIISFVMQLHQLEITIHSVSKPFPNKDNNSFRVIIECDLKKREN